MNYINLSMIIEYKRRPKPITFDHYLQNVIIILPKAILFYIKYL